MDVVGYAGLAMLAVGPSAGHIYTRHYGRALLGTGARVAGPFLLLLALVGDCESDCDDGRVARTVALGAGASLIVGSTLYGLMDRPLSAKRANKADRSSMTFSPTPMRGPQGSSGWGASASLSF